MDRIKNYLLAGMAVTIMLLILFKGCGDKCPPQTVIGSYDTEHIYDTITLHDTLIVPAKKPVSKPIETKPTVGVDTSISKVTNTYSDSTVSSDVVIYYKAKTIGILQRIDLSAKLINRKSIKETVNYFYHDTTYKQPRFSLYGGINLMGSKTSFDVGPWITLNFNKKSITASYDALNQVYRIGVGYLIFKSKK